MESSSNSPGRKKAQNSTGVSLTRCHSYKFWVRWFSDSNQESNPCFLRHWVHQRYLDELLTSLDAFVTSIPFYNNFSKTRLLVVLRNVLDWRLLCLLWFFIQHHWVFLCFLHSIHWGLQIHQLWWTTLSCSITWRNRRTGRLFCLLAILLLILCHNCSISPSEHLHLYEGFSPIDLKNQTTTYKWANYMKIYQSFLNLYPCILFVRWHFLKRWFQRVGGHRAARTRCLRVFSEKCIKPTPRKSCQPTLVLHGRLHLY